MLPDIVSLEPVSQPGSWTYVNSVMQDIIDLRDIDLYDPRGLDMYDMKEPELMYKVA